MNIKDLIKRSKELWTTPYKQRQWVRKTYELRLSGKHILLSGKYPRKA